MKLKWCPFCKSGQVKYDLGLPKGGFSRPVINCSNCGITFSIGVFGWGVSAEQIKRLTITAWNRRADDSKPPQHN